MKIQRERLLEIIKEEVEWARQARPQIEEEVSPWQKLAGMIQESPQVDPETGKYPPPADIPDEPSIPRSVHLDIIEYLEDMSGLTMKGSGFIKSRARDLLAKIQSAAGALQEAMDTESVVQQIESILNELSSQGLDNEGLKKILSQIIHDIDKGFVGERT